MAAGAVALVIASNASADEREKVPTKGVWGSLGLDGAMVVGAAGERSDVAYYAIETISGHVGIGRYAALSFGVGLPVPQLLFAAFAKSYPPGFFDALLAMGGALTMPIDFTVYPRGRERDGVVLRFGATPLVAPTAVCAWGETRCPGKPIAFSYGLLGEGGLGYEWSSGFFVHASYARGPLRPISRSNGALALAGVYQGGTLSVGFAF